MIALEDLQFPLLRSLIASDDSIKADIVSKAKQVFARNCLWVEHYPKETGLYNDDSYAVVNFGRDGAPSWSYITRTSVESMLNDPSFIIIDERRLSKWTT